MSILVPLTSAQKIEILKDFNFDENKLKQEVDGLRRWAGNQPNIPTGVAEEPDEFFANYIVGCKGELEAAKKKLRNYYNFRSRAEEISSADPLDPGIVSSSIDFHVLTLPQATVDGCRATLTHAGRPDVEDYNPLHIVQRLWLVFEIRLRSEPVHRGEYLIMDGENYTFAYFASLRPRLIKHIINLVQNVIPWRFKGIILIRSPRFAQIGLNTLVKPFLSKKLYKRVHIYTEGPEILTQHIAGDVLPNDYFGQDQSIKELSDAWMEWAKERRFWILSLSRTSALLNTDPEPSSDDDE